MQAIAEKRVGYDLSRFDRRTVVKEQVEREETAARARRRANVRTKPIISGFALFSSIVVFAMLTALLFSYVGLNEAADGRRQKIDELATLREQNQMLEVNCNQRIGELQIREYATTTLGMSKIDKSQITYVTTSGGDRFEFGADEDAKSGGLLSGIGNLFSGMIEFIN